MSNALLIDGWACRLVRGQRSAQNYALEMGAWLLPDGRVKTEGAETDGSPVTVTVPPLVLLWLMKPLLRSAYAQGWADRNGQLDGAEMPRIYEDQ
jgi:hypothetical protein